MQLMQCTRNENRDDLPNHQNIIITLFAIIPYYFPYIFLRFAITVKTFIFFLEWYDLVFLVIVLHSMWIGFPCKGHPWYSICHVQIHAGHCQQGNSNFLSMHLETLSDDSNPHLKYGFLFFRLRELV